ncbi:MAG: hypothetical protein KDA20_09945 [Phycisphaerales bacterium]|nr:hypothetical protein [Phycisphaerales bacterium]
MRNAKLAVGAVLGAVLAMGGCSGYHLQGRVVSGDVSYIAVVDPDDPRLQDGAGLPGVSLHLQSDPGRLNRKTAGRAVSGAAGEVNVPVDLTGAGLLEYDVGLFARRSGYDPATGFFSLPSSRKRVLIVMAKGKDYDLGEEREDLTGQAELYR